MGIAEVGETLASEGATSASLLGSGPSLATVTELLERREAERGAPLVDEAERLRLTRAIDADRSPEGWYPIIAVRDAEGGSEDDGAAVGYAGTQVAPDAELLDVDVVADPGRTLEVLVAAVGELSRRSGIPARVWLRAAGDGLVAAAGDLGLEVERRLAVLGRSLETPGPAPDPPGGVVLRAFEPDDEEAVVTLLAAAYEGTPDGGWTLEDFRERRDRDWFRPEDLIVAEGRNVAIEGIHWTKRRGEGIGEVHNLAVSPSAQGLGLGRALLRAGLRHLWRVGCSEVLLWTDVANDAAMDLYRSEGFEERWVDVAMRG